MSTPDVPLHAGCLKEAVVLWLEQLILCGDLQPGERLPSERDLAGQWGISRPVLHQALVELAARGLVTILPRRGVIVNDYRRSGSFAILSAIIRNPCNLSPRLSTSLTELRILLETETACLAAAAASLEEISALWDILAQEQQASSPAARADLDFDFHLRIAVASGNLVYPLILNALKNTYLRCACDFYTRCTGSPLLEKAWSLQSSLVRALTQHDASGAAAVMRALLLCMEERVNEINP